MQSNTKGMFLVIGGWVLALCAVGAQAQTLSATRVSSFEYDANGLLVREVVEPDRPNDCISTGYSYDTRGNKVSASTQACAGASGDAVSSAGAARTNTSQFAAQTVVVSGVSYNVPAGQFATSTSNALGHSESRTYDPRFGGLLSLTGPNGLTTRWEYDSYGRKTKELRADGTYSSWSYQYCSTIVAGGVSCPALSGGNAAAYVFTQSEYAANGTPMAAGKISYVDALGRVLRTQTQDYNGNTLVQDSTYNALGQLVSTTQPYVLGQTVYASTTTYDNLGRVLTQSSPDPVATGAVATVSYAYSGLSVTVTNPKGQRKTTVKNILGQSAQVIDHDGNQVLYSYDALGQLVQTNAAGQITTLSYDQRGRKVGMNDPSMGFWRYSYNVFGELVSQTDSLGQVSTMTYDVLGRMIARNEPDLKSSWYYDKDASGVACGKSVGKLCEARADSGYRRVHSYDSLGRSVSTSTAQDSSQGLSSVSVAFDANTGRMNSQTWPTGYQASYSFSATGFLQKVLASGAGAPTAQLDILAYDSQGRITSYKQGGKIVTNKSYDAATGRLMQIQAQVDGQSAGSVFKQAYTYDSLNNLLSKVDANTGVQESYTYDNLNRLITYNSLGGSISPPTSTQVVYDARGNIVYKSDAGRYWYDGQRPNRLTNITLESYPGAQALSGTRALSYAFDDYKAEAISQGATLKAFADNGPATFAPLAPGRTLIANGSPGVDVVYVGAGTNVDATNLAGGVDLIYLPGKWADYTKALDTANNTISFTRTINGVRELVKVANGTPTAVDKIIFADGMVRTYQAATALIANAQVGISSITGYDAATTTPTNTAGIVNSTGVSLYLSSGGVPMGNGNLMYTVSHDPQSGKHTVRWENYTSFNMPAEIKYGNIGSTQNSMNGATSDRTLNFVYGPEHQRVKQVVTLSNNAPTNLMGGTTWYLNGDNNNLLYEKEVKANGVTENRHYLQAAGMTFAMAVTRTGAGISAAAADPTKRPTQVEYYQQDHLGSIAAIADENGVVIERLAYDPWGKRRNVNGLSDNADALVGVNTDRGYTMHEHLDEVGVIHMNGRVYDPLIGRFMSADPFIQSPGNLQSYNRYAYVMNNPLAFTDPSGYWSLGGFLKSVVNVVKVAVVVYVAYTTGQWVGDAAMWALAPTSSNAAALGAIAGGAAGGAAAGATGAAINGGNSTQILQGGLQGGLTGALFGAAGTVGGTGAEGANSIARYAAHAGAGCISTVASGGGCGQGAVSAVFGKYTTNSISGWGGDNTSAVIARGVATSVAGGVGSEIAGGKFENGATTAAFGYLFNQLQNPDSRLSMADRAAGLDSSREKTDAFEKAFSSARPVVADLLDKGSKVFIYGAGGAALLPPPFDLPALPLAGIGAGMGLASDLLSPQPLKITTDLLVDKATSRLPGGAAAAGAAQAIKDLKNMTPIGNY